MKKLAVLLLLFSSGELYAGSCGYYGRSAYGSSYFWPGGYWSGGGGYAAGWYKSGYYPSYSSYNYYEEPVYIRYKVVVPLVDLPSYAIQYPTVATAPAVAPAMPATYPTPSAPAAGVAAGVDSKLDELLNLTKQNLSRTARLEARMDIVETKIGVPKAPSTPPPDSPGKEDDGPTVFFNRCASCHEAKVAQKLGKNLVLFVTTEEGPQMATLGADGKPAALPLETLNKVVTELTQKTMPPEKTKDGKNVPIMPEGERKIALDFIRGILANPRKGE